MSKRERNDQTLKKTGEIIRSAERVESIELGEAKWEIGEEIPLEMTVVGNSVGNNKITCEITCEITWKISYACSAGGGFS